MDKFANESGISRLWSRIQLLIISEKPKVYSQTLTAGSTSVTFNNIPTTANSLVDIATSVPDLEYNSMTQSGTSYTVTFDAQASNVMIYLIVTEVA